MMLAANTVTLHIGVSSWAVESLRALCVLIGIALLIALIPISTRQQGNWDRVKHWYLAIALFDTSVIFTEIGRFGHVMTWRLPVNTAAVVVGICAAIRAARRGD